MADELGFLLANQRGGNRGADTLGAILGGGAARSASVFNNAANQGAQMAERLALARQRQYDEIEKQRQRGVRHNIAERKRAQGNQDLGDFFDAYDNPNEIAGANEKLLQADALRKNLELADAPTVDYNHLNARKIAGAAGPTELVRSLGDGSFTNNAYRTDSPVQTSAIGDAFIREKNALAGEHGAQTERARAGIGTDKAANYRIEDTPNGKVRVNLLTNEVQPLTLNGQPVAKPAPAPKSFNEAELGALLSGPDAPGKPDPEKLSRFLLQPGASDQDRLRAMRADEAAAAETGPSADLANPVPNALSRLFGAGDGTSNAPVAPGLPVASPAVSGAPKVGEVRKGYRFKGGDPASQSNWEKV